MAEPGTTRVLVVTDLLLGAVYADGKREDVEIDVVKKILVDLTGKDPLPAVFEERIAAFDASAFDVFDSAEEFKKDEGVARKRLLELVASVRDADDEIDLAEDDYIKQLAAALDVSSEELGDLTLDYEIEDLAADLHLRSVPPPTPKG